MFIKGIDKISVSEITHSRLLSNPSILLISKSEVDFFTEYNDFYFFCVIIINYPILLS